MKITITREKGLYLVDVEGEARKIGFAFKKDEPIRILGDRAACACLAAAFQKHLHPKAFARKRRVPSQ